MRGLLRDFADRAGTVLLSSHLLREVEAIADELVVIGDGRIVAQGSKAELLATTGTLVRARDPEALLRRRSRAAGLTPTRRPTARSWSRRSPRRSAMSPPSRRRTDRAAPRRRRRARAAVPDPDRDEQPRVEEVAA